MASAARTSGSFLRNSEKTCILISSCYELWTRGYRNAEAAEVASPESRQKDDAEVAYVLPPDNWRLASGIYSGLMPASSTAFCHFARSLRMNFSNSAGVVGAAATPLSKNRCFRSGDSSALSIAPWIYAMCAFEVPFGIA